MYIIILATNKVFFPSLPKCTPGYVEIHHFQFNILQNTSKNDQIETTLALARTLLKRSLNIFQIEKREK